MDLEFVDESAPDDELLDAGSDRRIPRWAGGLLIAALLALAGFVVANRHESSPSPSPAPSRPVAAPTPTPRMIFTPLPKVLAGQNETFSAVYQRATDSTPATDIVRNGSNATSCRAVRLGTTPQVVAATALTTTLRGYTLVDSARIMDQNAGLCGLQVRAHAADGTVAVLVVAPPTKGMLPRDEELDTNSTTVGGTLVEYARFVTWNGWTIVAGTAGPIGKQPSESRLEDLASNTALRW